MKRAGIDIAAAHAAIWRAVAAIPAGRVASYGEIATRAGLPRRARLVGRVLRETPDDVRLPWHRVVRGDGHIAFTAESRDFREQVRRLAREGVRTQNGRVDLAMHGWDATVDEVLWGPGAWNPPSRGS